MRLLLAFAATLLLATLAAGAPPGQQDGDVSVAQARETRALWVSRFDFQTEEEVRTIVERAAGANFNTIFFQVRGTADALYRPGLEPWSAALTGTLGRDPGYDPLGTMLELAHARGLEVHAWVNVYPAWSGSSPPPMVEPTPMYHEFNSRYGDEWVQWTEAGPIQLGGEDYLYANPAHPAVVERVVAVCRDILSRYPVDGLHLDYARYAGPEYSFDPLSEREYARATAERPGLTRADWQREQVTGLVQRVRDEALPARPGARLSSTAWPVYIDRWGWFLGRSGYDAYYQDSQGWARNRLVSAITPMLYSPTVHDHPDRFETLGQDYVNGAQPGAVFLGIGADYDSFDPIAERIEISRRLDARGQGFFSYTGLEERDYWDDLRAGPYREPAEPNWP